MKLISKGLVNKVLESVDENQLRKSNEPIDNMGQAFKTSTNPYKVESSLKRNPLNDPNLFIIHFQRIL